MFNLYHNFDEFMNNMEPYNASLRCYSVIMMSGKERNDVNKGGKIILPASALDYLTRQHIDYPMLFRLTNTAKGRHTHCGVLEFVAEQGRCYIPYWMMRNLQLNEGDIIKVEYVKLAVAKFAKFQPQSTDFLEITNPKAVLENTLRSFATLTKNDMISIHYNDKDYELQVLETRPGDAVSIIECDMDVDFAPPIGYEEPTAKKPTTSKPQPRFMPKIPSKAPVNEGYRLDGKAPKKPADGATTSAAAANASSASAAAQPEEPHQRGVPNYDYKIGLLQFNRYYYKSEQQEKMQEDKEDKTKKGGFKLKEIGVKS